MPTASLLSSAAPSGTALSVASATMTLGVQSKCRGSLNHLTSTDSSTEAIFPPGGAGAGWGLGGELCSGRAVFQHI